MQERNRYAFKEWSVVCEALNTGVQSLILRKGGIQEGDDGFRVDHREFWLFPTQFHQQPEELAPAAHPLLEKIKQILPTPGMIAIRDYALVEEVIEIRDEAVLRRLAGLHVWSDSTLHERFHYRTPMLFALLVRLYRRPEPMYIPELSHFSGCRSWVDFPIEIETNQLRPVLDDDVHSDRLNRIRSSLREGCES